MAEQNQQREINLYEFLELVIGVLTLYGMLCAIIAWHHKKRKDKKGPHRLTS